MNSECGPPLPRGPHTGWGLGQAHEAGRAGMILKKRKCDPASLPPWALAWVPPQRKLYSIKATDTC